MTFGSSDIYVVLVELSLGAGMITDIAQFGNLAAYGYPVATNRSELIGCSSFFGTRACNRTGELVVPDLVDPSAQRRQTVYSNIAFPILSFAVEAIANQSFPDAGLAFIPPNDIWWSADLGFEGP
ncbi:hypothetical protein MYCTH_2128856 [Thermothelomyces thermophilus ATCC 42464]|uniref:Uncharacterized protein n=1 Tax=Thermothelomyces thermophilus (strain ATCC 42464 / BCRC 31852 / DSM 1799) TaxID=573729 RepID=G2QJL8_THET4|nr:uncharacterized protein MYCTH_2128856 [Thermothelomyces thermophilus ATCC 42464]AEO59775.1 hypothetical protein MYCTH_2128856 [Thermothelomyces thermophilus ATCC 42464]